MGRRSRSQRRREYLRKSVDLLQKVNKSNNDMLLVCVEDRIHRTVMAQAYNRLYNETRRKLSELTSPDEALMFMEENGFRIIDTSGKSTRLLQLLQEYVPEEEGED